MSRPIAPPGDIAGRRDGDDTIVSVVGEIDLLTAPGLRRALADAIAQRPRRVVLDLTRVAFMDSACAHAVIEATFLAWRSEVELELRRPPHEVGRVLDICGL